MNIKSTFFIFFILGSIAVQAQEGLKVMNYNVLTFPEGTANRRDTLGKVMRYYQPDLLLLQELKSPEGLQYLTEELNEFQASYQSGTYVEQIANPSNPWRLQQNIVYNEDKLLLVDEEAIVADYRDINYFKLYMIGSELFAPNDSIFLHVYVMHLKSSQGSSNEQLRLEMAQYLMNRIASLPANSHIIAGGDFNLYDSDEPAYQLMIGGSGSNQLFDPIDTPDWYNHDEVLTQSTRSNSPDNGAGGGNDDRFDFMLLSKQLMQRDVSPVAYKVNTYKALGNNGTCYNDDITDCNVGNPVPYSILNAMWWGSDHLPVVLELDYDNITSTEAAVQTEDKLQIYPNPATDQLCLRQSLASLVSINVYNTQGQLVLSGSKLPEEACLDVQELPTGVYFIEVLGGELVWERVVVSR